MKEPSAFRFRVPLVGPVTRAAVRGVAVGVGVVVQHLRPREHCG